MRLKGLQKIDERPVVLISAKTPNNLISGPKYSVELLSAYRKLAKHIVPTGPFVLCMLYFHKKYVLLEHFAEISKSISILTPRLLDSSSCCVTKKTG